MNTPLSTDRHTPHDEVVTFLAPPHVPFGFVLQAEPAPLLTPKDGRYIVRAIDEESGGAEGILIYEDYHLVTFLTADEVATHLAYLMREGVSLISAMNPALSEAHALGMEYMRSLWWQEETRKTRALVNASIDLQE